MPPEADQYLQRPTNASRGPRCDLNSHVWGMLNGYLLTLHSHNLSINQSGTLGIMKGNVTKRLEKIQSIRFRFEMVGSVACRYKKLAGIFLWNWSAINPKTMAPPSQSDRGWLNTQSMTTSYPPDFPSDPPENFFCIDLFSFFLIFHFSSTVSFFKHRKHLRW